MICGAKLTHDGAVAVIDCGALAFSIDVEKVANNPRYSPLRDLRLASELLRGNGVEPGNVDRLAIDGWFGVGGCGRVPITDERGAAAVLAVAPYAPASPRAPLAAAQGELRFGGRARGYRSYPHTVDHVFAGYCTSPFARDRRPALVLVWDGGTPAWLYEFDPATRRLRDRGCVLAAAGDLYPVFASFLGPFRATVDWTAALSSTREEIAATIGEGPTWRPLLEISGKAMAYAGLGEISEEGIAILRAVSERGIGRPMPLVWTSRCVRRLAPLGLSDASAMATFQELLYRELERGLERAVRELPSRLPLCFVGGCALNIKFNARLRASGLFDGVWVPPFPNDAGSAIGAACTEWVRGGGEPAVRWSVFSGPQLGTAAPVPGWVGRTCAVEEVGELLAADGEPVVVLAGRAELGPRALGHRSILAPATQAAVRSHLNDIKRREPYRPVAPVCLHERASDIFAPGTPDPHMLFDHAVRPAWRHRIPAVVHADGTARLQTVDGDNRLLRRLLEAYDRCTGVPVLCNTSANLKGSGFFPDAQSAMRWGRVARVWADGTLFTHVDGAAAR
jgi:carbamoyltransferase